MSDARTLSLIDELLQLPAESQRHPAGQRGAFIMTVEDRMVS